MRILLLGLGSVGKKHLAAIKRIDPSGEVFAFRSKISSDNISGVKNIYSINEVSLDTFNFALIANPTSEHKNTIRQFLDSDLPLFIEKPVSFSLDIEETVKEVVRRGIKTYVACNLRFLDCIKYIKEQIEHNPGKRLNEVNVYCGSYLPDWRPNVDFRQVYSVNADQGGGVHIDLIHELDYLYWMFGKPFEVYRKFKSKSTLAISSVDYANYILDYDSFSANIILNYYRRDNKRSLELVFSDETWNVDLLKNLVTGKNGTLFSSTQNILDTYDNQMEYFMGCLINNEKTFNTIDDGFNVLKICLEEDDTK